MGIRAIVKRKLWASSGGYCANPTCHDDLFPFFETGEITNIDELAHIIGQKENGPRGKNQLPITDRDEFNNIVLLCPSCHTTIDKNPNLFSEQIISNWKQNHEESIKNLFVCPRLETREEVSKVLKPLFAENKAIFNNYGPFSKNAFEKQASTELMWERLAIQKILPNNRKIEQVIDLYQHLLKDDEYGQFIEFRLHREGFEFNKLSGDVNDTVPSFPVNFENIFS